MNRIVTKQKHNEKARTSPTFGPFSSPCRRFVLLLAVFLISCGGAGGADSRPAPSDLRPADEGAASDVRLNEGRSLVAAGEAREGIGVLLGMASDAPAATRIDALNLIRSAAPELSFLDLEALGDPAMEPDPGSWPALTAPVLARYAEELYVRGRAAEAREAAEAALDRSLAAMDAEDVEMSPEAELARAVLDGEVARERRGRMVLGALLPESGSPSERQYAALIRDGIRARVESRDPDAPLTVELEMRDDSGSVGSLSGLLGDLQGRGTMGIVGPLTNALMDAAIEMRQGALPLISPTVQPVPQGVAGVYSLNGLDPGGPELLARFARSRGLGTAVILHAGTVEHGFEARVFAEEFGGLGGSVLRTIEYPPGATFFEEHLALVQQLRPEALVLPVPEADIELLAPQLTYFGLDTLGVRVLGTESWAEPEVVSDGDPRHLNGIVVATPRPPGEEMPGWDDFVADYEGVHRQTLRSRAPALGYDAAGLLLEAAAVGARDPDELRAALESIEDFPGATGYISLVDGEVRRRYHLLRLRENEVIPLSMEDGLGRVTP